MMNVSHFHHQNRISSINFLVAFEGRSVGPLEKTLYFMFDFLFLLFSCLLCFSWKHIFWFFFQFFVFILGAFDLREIKYQIIAFVDTIDQSNGWVIWLLLIRFSTVAFLYHTLIAHYSIQPFLFYFHIVASNYLETDK